MPRKIVLLCAFAAALPAQNLMPWPARLARGSGVLKIESTFQVAFTGYQEPRLQAAAARLVRVLAAETGIPILAGSPVLTVNCERAGETVQSVNEDESYRLTVTTQGARIDAVTPVGALRGMATFFQLVELGPEGFRAPAVSIQDAPRFAWRGLMIDVSRHWIPLEVLKRNMDAMAAVKMNVLHLHLSDDQGFRVESKRFPKLQELGSDGHYFTQSQIGEIVAYARDRGIRVVPEFDIPGHTTAWLVGYPEFGSAPGPYRIERKWGIMDPCLDPTNEALYPFLDALLNEMAALFPDAYFHIGGDEVNGKQWKANPRIQEFKRAHGMTTEHDLQAYFNKRLLPILAKSGKKVIGWDEVLHPDLPKDIVVHSWRGQKSLAQAARQGYSGILSAGYYLDLMHHTDSHYSTDPLEGETAGLTPAEQKRILGGEACEWSEFATPEIIDARIWPRNAAIAERLWSPQSVRDVDSMYQRMAVVSRKLDWTGVTHLAAYRRMTERLAAGGPVDPVRVLAEVVEPVKNYQRSAIQKGAYTSFSPLNRMVDVARPESWTARDFGKLLAQLPASAAAVRRQLTIWRDNEARLAPLLLRSALLAEIEPLSHDLAALANAGLEALDRIEAGKHDAAWADRQKDLLAGAAKPRAELLLSAVEPIRKLIEMAR